MRENRTSLANAVLQAGARLGGRPVDRRSETLADLLQRSAGAGVRPGHVVGIGDTTSERLLLTVIAAWMQDAVAWPLAAPSHGCDCAFVVSSDGTVVRGGAPDRTEPPNVGLLHTTSGSSAAAKTARRSVASIVLEANGYRSVMRFEGSDRVGVPLPVSHSFGSGFSISALLSGCDVYADHQRLPSAIAKDLDTGTLNKIALTPSLAYLLTRTRCQGAAVPDGVFVGAGVLSEDLALSLEQRFGVTPKRGYGSTETGGIFVGDVGIGTPIKGVQVVWPPRRMQGELVLRTQAPVLGHVGNQHRTIRTWRTGDIVHRDEADDLRFVRRRSDESLRLNGRFVDLRGLNALLDAVPQVSAYSAIALPDDRRKGLETLYIVVATDHLTAGEVSQYLQPLGQFVSAQIVTCAALPRNGIGKLDREALRRMVRHQ